ncbi:hypothetical protein [Sporisorium scitamineum]|uniref:Uncharacterized protein n=1 Tax=Sporisorium scitamineum TaxID=49012 RepID=A0A0F7SC88_9BASI|nr:hypothetical protein [Sporisorium scitamineum]
MSPALKPPAQVPAPEQELQATESRVPANTFMLSSSVSYDLPGPSWQPAGPHMPPMLPFM